jgi:hypothetical protein
MFLQIVGVQLHQSGQKVITFKVAGGIQAAAFGSQCGYFPPGHLQSAFEYLAPGNHPGVMQ